MSASSFAHTQKQSIDLSYLGQASQKTDVILKDSNTWIPISYAQSWGWLVTKSGRYQDNIEVGSQTITTELEIIDGVTYIPLERVLRKLDSEVVQVKGNPNDLLIESHVRVVKYLNNHIYITTSLPVSPSYNQGKGNKLEVYLQGTSLSPDVIYDLAPGITIDQPTKSSVRIEVDDIPKVDVSKLSTSSQADLDIAVVPVTPREDVVAPILESNQKVYGVPVSIQQGDGDSFQVLIPFPHRLSAIPTIKILDSNSISINLPGVRLSNSTTDSKDQQIDSISLNPNSSSSTFKLKLNVPMGFVASFDTKGFLLQFKPVKTDAPLLTNLIVVDPGHGGSDSGAPNYGVGVLEKNITLDIGQHLAADLASKGAGVYLTRNEDRTLTLGNRALQANISHAALFLCVHINSTNSQFSGSITFYHASNTDSKLLGTYIQNEVKNTQTIPSVGVWSDHRIYRSGFEVLRETNMPGVLCELGFITSSNDVHQLLLPDIRASLAKEIATGAEKYLTRNSR